MHYDYWTQNTCAKKISFDLDGDVVRNIKFLGGCDGNLQGISRLVEGMEASEIETRCTGIRCGLKSTSCPDQLAQALKQAREGT